MKFLFVIAKTVCPQGCTHTEMPICDKYEKQLSFTEQIFIDNAFEESKKISRMK